MTRARLVEVAAEIASYVDADPRLGRVTDVLVACEGEVVAHHRWRGAQATDRRNVFSVTKTVTALVTGIAVADGLVGLDQPVAGAPRLRRFPQLEGLTVRHLLTMTRGAVPGGRFDLDQVAVGRGNWAEQFAAAPVDVEPGTTFRYDDGCSQLLAELLHHTTGDLRAYAHGGLFGPLQIDGWAWAGDATGVPCGASHLELGAVSLSVIGDLLCRRGLGPGGARLVPAPWVDIMRTPATPGGPPEHRAYGAGLWIEDAEAFFAAGWAGQLMWCRPSDRTVVVTLADPAFSFGPPPTDDMPPDWVAPLPLVRDLLAAP